MLIPNLRQHPLRMLISLIFIMSVIPHITSSKAHPKIKLTIIRIYEKHSDCHSQIIFPLKDLSSLSGLAASRKVKWISCLSGAFESDSARCSFHFGVVYWSSSSRTTNWTTAEDVQTIGAPLVIVTVLVVMMVVACLTVVWIILILSSPLIPSDGMLAYFQ